MSIRNVPRLSNFDLAYLRFKLESYRDLPPDVGLARVKVAEAEMELSALTSTLNKQINVMHV